MPRYALAETQVTVYNVIKSMTKYKKDAKILERKNITKVCKHMQKVWIVILKLTKVCKSKPIFAKIMPKISQVWKFIQYIKIKQRYAKKISNAFKCIE